jgi:hypothetical protein
MTGQIRRKQGCKGYNGLNILYILSVLVDTYKEQIPFASCPALLITGIRTH